MLVLVLNAILFFPEKFIQNKDWGQTRKSLDDGFVKFNDEWSRGRRLRCLWLHEAAFLLLLLRVLDRLQREHLLRLHLEQLFKKLIDVGALLGWRFDVFALPHSLQFWICIVFNIVVLVTWRASPVFSDTSRLPEIEDCSFTLSIQLLACLLITLVPHKHHWESLQTTLHL